MGTPSSVHMKLFTLQIIIAEIIFIVILAKKMHTCVLIHAIMGRLENMLSGWRDMLSGGKRCRVTGKDVEWLIQHAESLEKMRSGSSNM